MGILLKIIHLAHVWGCWVVSGAFSSQTYFWKVLSGGREVTSNTIKSWRLAIYIIEIIAPKLQKMQNYNFQNNLESKEKEILV